MAKGNLFQGMASGAVGDVVFQRRDGQQISMVRNRAPHNPRSDEQLYQRAILGTVSQLYRAGHEIFDHAWENLGVGLGTQSKFLSTNAKILRNILVDDLKNGTARGHFIAPNLRSAVPFDGMQVSEGTYYDNIFRIRYAGVGQVNYYAMPSVDPRYWTVVPTLLQSGWIAGDYYTAIGFVVDKTKPLFSVDNTENGTVYESKFVWVRWRCKDIKNAHIPVPQCSLLDLFEYDSSNIQHDFILNTILYDYEGRPSSINPSVLLQENNDVGVISIIRSAPNLKNRSKAFMHLMSEENNFGLTPDKIIPAWQQISQTI